jgi:hypothetical protein
VADRTLITGDFPTRAAVGPRRTRSKEPEWVLWSRVRATGAVRERHSNGCKSTRELDSAPIISISPAMLAHSPELRRDQAQAMRICIPTVRAAFDG